MKKMLICAVALMVAALAWAGTVYDRAEVAMGTTTGTATWTNTYKYAAVKLVGLGLDRCLLAGDTVTVSRVYYTGSYTNTNTVVALVASSSKAHTNQFTNLGYYLKYGDKLTFASGTGTGALGFVEFEIQQH